MCKLIITFGLPGSGKSTWLKSHYPEEYIVSADEIKKSFSGYTDKNHANFYQDAVKKAKELLLEKINNKEKLVIFDSGSINNNYTYDLLATTYGRASNITLIVFTAFVDTCIERDKGRPQSVGESVIRKKVEKAPEALFKLLPFIDNVVLVHD